MLAIYACEPAVIYISPSDRVITLHIDNLRTILYHLDARTTTGSARKRSREGLLRREMQPGSLNFTCMQSGLQILGRTIAPTAPPLCRTPVHEESRPLLSFHRSFHCCRRPSRRILNMSTGSSSAGTNIAPIRLFIHILSSCTRLYGLVLDAYGIHGFDPEDLAKLQRHDLSPIRALRLTGYSESRVLYQLLEIWPTIQFLCIDFELNADPPAHATRVKLYELSLLGGLSVKVMTWLLSSSELSLQIFELRYHFGNDHARVLAKHGPHIRSLRVLSPTSEVQSLVENCPNLEELIVTQAALVQEPTRRLANILSSTSQSLEHLGVWVGAFEDYFWNLNYAVNHLQRLRVLSYYAPDGELENHSRYSEIQSKCEEKKIDLRLLKIMTWKRMEDPVPVALFPRGISISHFRFMN
ncbi:uncharacterized protein LAESUDRAFT_411876 [Laetiporus sulphureus 93-53]|uniref:F-box domain-containing protein n=1 Tax=Laetiporus sulphureus 93-53 TaxID=1314785 RepID=A0A165CBI5_9APHY|nr:uncharacterized protein LAESUDRAFT_411876 [Laetiporus sulphureus 93-53]KZT02508.1 hypothetical protein LAESUDRAFT_411876 [Laetiporus sulphureus 93-53]